METNNLPDEVMTFFKTLANLERIKIAGLIAIEELSPAQIAERTGMKPEVVYKGLEQLVPARLALEKTSGDSPRSFSQSAVYSLDARHLNELSHQVLSGSRPKAQLEEFEGEDYDRKVLRDFLRADGTLKSVPTQQKKLLAVLSFLAQEFEPGRKYPEKEVNIILARRYPYAASLRRYLVDNGLLARESGVYWRVEREKYPA
jgi:hypothetical protein